MNYLLITLFSNCKDLSDQRQRLADSSIMFKFGCLCFCQGGTDTFNYERPSCNQKRPEMGSLHENQVTVFL